MATKDFRTMVVDGARRFSHDVSAANARETAAAAAMSIAFLCFFIFFSTVRALKS
jgi:hypothetical protein